MFLERGILVSVLIFLGFGFSACIDTITLTRPVKDGDLLVSNGETFALGFFSPANSSDRYVGIWYHKISEQTVVWVANGDSPISNSFGILSVDPTGNLVLQEKDQSFVFWSTNVSRMGNDHDFSAQLLDSGNLVLFQGTNKEDYSWQSLDYPSNTYLPDMKLGLDRKTGLNREITSWKSTGNPSVGDCSWKLEYVGSTQMFLVKGMTKIWRGGSWTGRGFSGIPLMVNDPIIHPTYINNEDEVVTFFQMSNWSIFTRFVVNETGTIERLIWNEEERKWIGYWSAPKDQCDNYNHCGPFGICDPNIAATFECDCLPGYEPYSPQDWRIGDSSKGCMRKVGTQICKAGEGFVELAKVKVPDTSMALVNMSLGLEACKGLCLRNCTCTGYASGDISKAAEGGGCITWYEDMNDIRTFTDGGQSFYIRVDANELAKYSSKTASKSNKARFLLYGMPVIAAGFVLCISIYCYVKKKNTNQNEGETGSNFKNNLKTLEGSNMEKDIGRNVDLDVFDLSTIVVATDNFSPLNKLGEGGFGSVYKGKLLNGQEIAIKRLSQSSGQGMQEFKNEVTLIAKLQHRNLVRLLGYCFHEEEKMLVYEYLPNRGLDSFIFDLNPKISDFGLAKIFGGDEDEAITRKVVGTYGYMSPEYAMEGLFSVKSDVFSFGVLVMEIISGRKNNSYYKEKSINLIGHVWDLWKQDKALEAVDSSLGDSFDAREVLLCIHVGILCVQELASDRPTMTGIAFMLSNHETMLPIPNQPAFIFRQVNYGRDLPSTSASSGVKSVDDETITILQAR